MKKKELIEILKKQAISAYKVSKGCEIYDRDEKLDCKLKRNEAYVLQDVIMMLEDKGYYAAKKAVFLNKSGNK